MNSRWGHERVFLAALTFSFLVHLSMVTVFRIVVTFPREEVLYYDVSLVEASELDGVFGPVVAEALEAPSASDALERLEQGGTSADVDSWPSLPSVDLPRLSFSELDLVRLSQTSLDARSRYDDLFEDEAPEDLWAQVGRRLNSVGELLTSGRRGVLQDEPESKRIFAGHPATGVDIYIEWMTPPYDRQMLVMQPIKELWGADVERLQGAIVFVIRVNPAGRVTFVQMPLDETDGLMNTVAGVMFRNLFEPLDELNAGEQHATVFLERGEGR